MLALEKTTNSIALSIENVSFLELIYNGFFMSAGVVIPGVSNTVILMILGTYNIYLEALATLNFAVLVPMGIGLLIGGFLFLKLIEFLFFKI